MNNLSSGKSPGRAAILFFFRPLLLLFFWLLLTLPLSGQNVDSIPVQLPDFFTRPASILSAYQTEDADSTASARRQDRLSDSLRVRSQLLGIGFTGGSKGLVGGDLAFRVLPHFFARIGFNYLDISFSDFRVGLGETGYGDEDLLLTGQIAQNYLEVLLEYAFASDRVRIVAGGAYHLDNRIFGEGLLGESLTVNDLVISPEEVGYLRGEFAFGNTFSPYLGLGFGRAIPRNIFGISFEVGTYYRGSPRIDLEASNLLRNNVNNEASLEENLAFVRWWPVVALRLAFKLL